MRYQKKRATNQDDEFLVEISDETDKRFLDLSDAYIYQGRYFYYDGDEKCEDLENVEDIQIQTYSRYHKIRMNRLFRERVGGAFIPFTEVDNYYERVRSKIVVILKINEFLDFCKKRSRKR